MVAGNKFSLYSVRLLLLFFFFLCIFPVVFSIMSETEENSCRKNRNILSNITTFFDVYVIFWYGFFFFLVVIRFVIIRRDMRLHAHSTKFDAYHRRDRIFKKKKNLTFFCIIISIIIWNFQHMFFRWFYSEENVGIYFNFGVLNLDLRWNWLKTTTNNVRLVVRD